MLGDGVVRVFNDAGMEIFTFGQDPEVGHIRNVAALSGGDLLALAYGPGGLRLVRCTFRGEFLGVITPRDIPAEFGGQLPTEMRYRNGKIYLADLAAMRVLVIDESGAFVASYDVAEKLEIAAKREQTPASAGSTSTATGTCSSPSRRSSARTSCRPLARSTRFGSEGQRARQVQRGQRHRPRRARATSTWPTSSSPPSSCSTPSTSS